MIAPPTPKMLKEFIYDPVNNNKSKLILDKVRSNLIKNVNAYVNINAEYDKNRNTTENCKSQKKKVSVFSLKLISLRKDYSLSLLTQFYNDLIIPNFPSEDSRDDLEDWIEMLDPQKVIRNTKLQPDGPLMDIIILVLFYDNDRQAESVESISENFHLQQPITILAGMVFEYYQVAQAGLVSYLAVLPSCRRCGIMNLLHPVGIQALRSLHLYAYHHRHHSQPKQEINAIFAETSTIHNQESSVETVRSRHEALYALGYRRLNFPYAQPPLEDHDMVSTKNMMLLIWCNVDKKHQHQNLRDQQNHNYSANSLQPYPSTISTEIPYAFVLDFFMAVFGYDTITKNTKNTTYTQEGTQRNSISTGAFQHDWYYRLATWYRSRHQVCTIDPSLPWDDITNNMLAEYEVSLYHQSDYDGKNDDINITDRVEVGTNPCMITKMDTVVIVGAGMAGLTATLKLADIAAANKRPLNIVLVEANSFVGGRTRTILPKNCKDILFSSEVASTMKRHDVNSNKNLKEICKPFHPWPVPIGAEFIHGVGSCLNKLIMECTQDDNNDWTVEETFDLRDKCEYTSNDSFVDGNCKLSVRFLSPSQRKEGTVKIFGDGKQWSLFDGEYMKEGLELDERFPRLIRKSKELWNELCTVNEELCSNNSDDKSNNQSSVSKRGCNSSIIHNDMSLSTFVEVKMASESEEDIKMVKHIMDSVYAKTAGTTIDMYGVNEASREDCSWDYTEYNFRTKDCFADIVAFQLSRIYTINSSKETGYKYVQIDLRTNCPIDKVESNPVRPKVKLSSSQTNSSFIADKAIISVPLSILKAEKIQFQGDFALPADKRLAIDKINMLPGMKSHILLRKREDIIAKVHAMEHTELIFCPGEIFSQVWLRRDETSVFLTGFVVADDRDTLKCRIASGDSAKSLFLDQLNRMFLDDVGQSAFINPKNPTCSAFALYDWADDEYTMGVYSSPSVGAGWRERNLNQFSTEKTPTRSGGSDSSILETCRHFLAKPIKNTIFFAGEHTNIKTCATVQAAMESGDRAAGEVTESLLSN